MLHDLHAAGKHPPVLTLDPFAGAQRFFASPAPQGRRITAGFSSIQRIGKSSSIDVWYPDDLRRRLDALLAAGQKLTPALFPAAWAALRQFELLQEGGNYKIYDLDAAHMTRSMHHLARDMRAGGYRVTVATLGSYDDDTECDDLHILDRRLQDRLSRLIHMLYLEESSQQRSAGQRQALDAGCWDYRTALPHIGATLSAGDLFRPAGVAGRQTHFIPAAPHHISVANWRSDLGVTDAETGQAFKRVPTSPASGQYKVSGGIYEFAAQDGGRAMAIAFTAGDAGKLSAKDRRQRLARQFFDALSLLPSSHIVHDTAIGLQLPELVGEHEWIYLSPGDETLASFNRLLSDLFTPFDRISLGGLQGRADAGREMKASTVHMRGTGDRLTPQWSAFYQGLARYGL